MSMRVISGIGLAAAVLVCCVGGCGDMKLSASHEEAASARSPITNSQAPDFTLPDQDDKPVTLGKLRGKWVVLYFYPKDDTPGCTCEATEFTKLMGDLRDMDAVVYGISADSPETHKVFVEKYGLGLDLLSDRDHKVMTSYGAWVETGLGDKKYGDTVRRTFVIGPDGVVRRHWPEVVAAGHAKRVKDWLARLQADSKQGG